MGVLVVGGSPEVPDPASLARLARDAGLVVAADAGLAPCLAAGVVPDVLVGDMDSVDPSVLMLHGDEVAEVVRLPREKDDSDLARALDLVAARTAGLPGGIRLRICGVSGGRLDHQLAVLGVLASRASLRPEVVDGDLRIWVIGPGDVWCARDHGVRPGQCLSVMALASGSRVSEAGLHWELDHVALEVLSDLGLSNICEEDGATVTCHGGVLAIIVDGR